MSLRERGTVVFLCSDTSSPARSMTPRRRLSVQQWSNAVLDANLEKNSDDVAKLAVKEETNDGSISFIHPSSNIANLKPTIIDINNKIETIETLP